MEKHWYVYVVRCRDDKLYTGISNNVQKRIDKHSRGKGCKFTRRRYPVELVYQEDCITKSLACKRELQIQSLTRGKKLKLIKNP